jgi:signal transduction histidine kinase/HD-like signal output (HDOD) protein
MNDPREKRVELILQQLEDLPTLPAVAVRVLEVTGRDDSSQDDVVRLLESDPSLTTRILQLVRRSDLGVRGEVNTVARAVSLLGFDAVRSSVLALSVFQTLSQNNTPGGGHFNRESFWKHSVAVACCSELLAEKLPQIFASANRISPATAFVAGLVHDIGKVALDAILPKSFNRVVEGADLLRGNIADLERNIIGLDHLVVGKRLAERWQLPSALREVIWLHGQLPEGLPASVENSALVNLITLADLLVREQHLGYSGNYIIAGRSVLLSALSLKSEQVEDCLKRLVAHIEPRAAALGLGQTSSDEMYRDALTQANRELGRISSQLAAKNRKLLVRAKFFDALSQFQGELRPDAPPQKVLHAIAQTGAEVLGARVVGAFSLPPAAAFAETVLVNETGELFETTLIDCVTRPPKPTEGDGPVTPASDELEWLVAAISPRLADRGRFWICLEADNQCIGGVVWGAAPGESQRLGTQVQEISALAHGWSLALRTAQIREEARNLNEQLADSNRRLHSAQNEILRSRTMLSVGEMAAGAAHEMNNPLAVISGRSQLLAQQLTDPRMKHAASTIHDQSHRLSEIITELMDFAQPTPPQPAAADVSDLVGRALHDAKMLSEHADRNVEVTLTDVPPVRVDQMQVSAALTELIGNALQAIEPTTGHIEIHAGHDTGSGQVVLSITDNGCGMDEQTLKRAFDPFFSAKPAGRRRGMGLAKALRWIEASGGSIRLESRPGQGTRSVILLPMNPLEAEDQMSASVLPLQRQALTADAVRPVGTMRNAVNQ